MLEWTFSPPDYFEEPIHITRDQYEMTIGNGKVEAKVNDVIYEENPEMRNQLHEALNDRFLVIQFLTHNPYELSKSSVCKIHLDGHKDLFVFAETGRIEIRADNVDLVVRDKDGNIVGDTRRERIDKKRTIAELEEKHRTNPILKAILNSYNMAVIEPDNELVHLYEIRDALAKELGGEDNTKNILGISNTDWGDFGLLANNLPVKQGRHRGKHVGALRDATHEELINAREFSQKLILSFLDYLENQVKSTP